MMKNGTCGMTGTSTPMTPRMKKTTAKTLLRVLLRRVRDGECDAVTARLRP